jgi:hypothetical protein
MSKSGQYDNRKEKGQQMFWAFKDDIKILKKEVARRNCNPDTPRWNIPRVLHEIIKLWKGVKSEREV